MTTKIISIESQFTPYFEYDIPIEVLKGYYGEDVLILCAREGQVKRVSKIVAEQILPYAVLGVWQQPKEEFLKHFDTVLVLDPKRIGYPELKSTWEQYIKDGKID